MYFSFIHTSDLIIWLNEMVIGSVSSKCRVEPESKKNNINDILN